MLVVVGVCGHVDVGDGGVVDVGVGGVDGRWESRVFDGGGTLEGGC